MKGALAQSYKLSFTIDPPLPEKVKHTIKRGDEKIGKFEVKDGTIEFNSLSDKDEGRYTISCRNDTIKGEVELEVVKDVDVGKLIIVVIFHQSLDILLFTKYGCE